MIKELVKDEFSKDVNEEAVLLKFYSKTCGPCKMLNFVLTDINKTYDEKLKIVNIDFEENPDLIEEYDVEGYPTIVMLKNGEEISRKSGLQQKPVITKMIEEAI